MALIAVQDVDLAGIDPAFTAVAASGDTFENANERVMVRIQNSAGGARTITIAAVADCNQGFTHDVVIVTADTDDITVGPFDKERFNTSAGQVAMTYDDETNVAVAILNLTVAP